MNQQTTEPERAYIRARIYCTGGVRTNTNGRSFLSYVVEYQHTDESAAIGKMVVRTKFYQQPGDSELLNLFVETEIGYPSLPFPLLRLPDANLGGFKPISEVMLLVQPTGVVRIEYIDERFNRRFIANRMLWQPAHVAIYLRNIGKAILQKADAIDGDRSINLQS